MADVSRLLEIEHRLDEYYGELSPSLRGDPLDELVGTILSQNTSDLNSERAFRSLKQRFEDWDAVCAADESAVIDAIRLGGLAQVKGPRIKRVLERIREDRGNITLDFLRDLDPTATRAYLTSLPGVGLKTAACVQLFALGQPAMPVDTHVHRVAIRLGLIPPRTSADKAHELIESQVTENRYFSVHVHLIQHGRALCKALKPRCGECPLASLCPKIDIAGADHGLTEIAAVPAAFPVD